VTIFIQARMNSKRLPGKVLKEINGKPLLGYLLERVNQTGLANAVLTPGNTAGPIDRYLGGGEKQVPYTTDIHEDDVAGRFRDAQSLNVHPWFVRVCGDSPLLDPDLIKAALNLWRYTGAKIVSNPHYPQGQRVEVIDTQYFLDREPLMTEPQDREHATPFLYRNAKPGEWVEFHCNRDMRFDVSMAVDTQADFDRIERVIKRMDRPHTEYTWRECMQLAWEESRG
jgi:spore coat polysaccharide biosynthesis protein SpsF